MLQIAPGVDPGDFILSGGTLKQPARRKQRVSTLTALIDDYLANQSHKAKSTVYTEGVHLRNLKRKLGAKVESSIDRIGHRELESHIQTRLEERSPATVHKERSTVIGLFRWAVEQDLLDTSPADRLSPFQGKVDQPPFRTIAEFEAIATRGGLSETEASSLRDCLYLTPAEVAALLGTVHDRTLSCDDGDEREAPTASVRVE